MKLDLFLKEPSFRKYSKEVEQFRDEFISEGCEVFLWTSFEDSMKGRDCTERLEKVRGISPVKPFIIKFIEQFDVIEEDQCAFIYPEDYSPKFLMAQEVSKTAVKRYVINNIFAEDDTKNWIAIFNRKDIRNISMMYHIVYSNVGFTADNYGGYKLFHKGLMYYADCLQYNGNLIEPEWPKLLAHFQGIGVRRDTNPRIILESRKVTKMLVRLGYFQDEYEIYCNLWKCLLPFLHEMYLVATEIIQGEDDWKQSLAELKSEMVSDGRIVSKWKSEQTLFTLVKKQYPDALFQFRPLWLEPQNLDIFIPSENIGIEYQGIQHYESIDFFGGQEAFLHRQQLDKRKKELCEINGLKLILWPYTLEISLNNLQKEIDSLCI